MVSLALVEDITGRCVGLRGELVPLFGQGGEMRKNWRKRILLLERVVLRRRSFNQKGWRRRIGIHITRCLILVSGKTKDAAVQDLLISVLCGYAASEREKVILPRR